MAFGDGAAARLLAPPLSAVRSLVFAVSLTAVVGRSLVSSYADGVLEAACGSVAGMEQASCVGRVSFSPSSLFDSAREDS